MTTSPPSSTSRDPGADPLWRLRWWLLASGLLTLAALIVLKITQSLPFHWPLFLWGIAVGLAGAVWVYLFCSSGIRLNGQRGRLEKLRHRRVIYTWVWLFIGIEAGMLATMFSLPWLIVAVAIYIAMLAGASVLVLRVLKRRQRFPKR
jgi:hypothetical protein